MSYNQDDFELKKLAQIELLERELQRAKKRNDQQLIKHYEFIIKMKRYFFIFRYYADRIFSFIIAIFGGK